MGLRNFLPSSARSRAASSRSRARSRALRVSDVHGLEDGTEAYIDVHRSWDDKEGEIAPKSAAGTRRVPLPETLRSLLADHVDRAERSGDEFVFGATGRSPFSPSYVRALPTERGISRASLASPFMSAGTGTRASWTPPESARRGLTAISVTPERPSATDTGTGCAGSLRPTPRCSTSTSSARGRRSSS